MTHGYPLLTLLSPDQGINVVVKGLAVVGGAAIGALLVGLLAQLLSKVLTAQKLPRLLLQIFRVIGGVLVGCVIYLCLFGGGGGGFGGPGGGWFGGGGSGTGPDSGPTAKDKERPPRDRTKKDKDRKEDEPPLKKEAVLQLEVLTDPEVEKLAGKKAVEEKRFFRLKDAEPADLLTLDELKAIIRKRIKDKPPLQRLDILTGPNSPDPDSERVMRLRTWAADQGLTVATPTR